MPELVQILLAVIALLGVILTKLIETRRGKKTERSEIIADIELLKSLPEESTARSSLLENIDRRVHGLSTRPTKTRYWFGIVLSIVLLAGGGYGAYAVYLTWPAWWFALPIGLATASATTFGITGLAIYTPKKVRGANGQALPDIEFEPVRPFFTDAETEPGGDPSRGDAPRRS